MSATSIFGTPRNPPNLRNPYADCNYPPPQGPENQYLAPQVPEQVLQVSPTMVVRLLLIVMRLLLCGMTVPLEKARESCVFLIMHGG